MAQKSITSYFKPSSLGNMKHTVGTEIIPSKIKKQKMHEKDSCTSRSSCNPINAELQAEINEQCLLTPALHSNIGESWYRALKPEFNKPYFRKLSVFVAAERKQHEVFPPEDQVYSWTQHCSINDIRVVILGQDPYHDDGQAHGLCFSVQPGVKPPPSLKNIYKELETDISNFKQPNHGYLLGWAKQGVLLLNAVLTVRAHKANSHKDKGWEKFTSAVIRTVAENNKDVVFLLWGDPAKKRVTHIKQEDHHLLSCAHPSPLSAYRGFLGCQHFSKCNELLQQQGKQPIDWGRLPLTTT